MGFEAAAGYLLYVLSTASAAVVLGVPAGAGDKAWWIVAQLAACALAALLLLGGVQLIRGTGRLLVLVATALELAAALGLVVVALIRWPEAGDVQTGLPGVAGDVVDLVVGWLIVTIAVVLAWLVVRVWLVLSPSVGRWLRAEETARQAPVWSAEQREGAGRPAQRVRRARWAVLLPVGALAVGSLLLALFGEPSTPGVLSDGDGDAGYRGDSPWGQEFFQGGQPLAPPAPGDQLYDAAADTDARSCAAGDMAACDSLFFSAPVDGLYEWYGSSCAGRLDHESRGGCVDELGPVVD